MAREVLTGGDGQSGQTGLETRESINRMTSELYASKHTRSHNLASSDDHAPATGADKGKFVATNPTTGAAELRFIGADDIPDSIARQAALEEHEADFNNPHQVTAAQLGIGENGGPTAGQGLNYDEIGVLNAYARENGGLQFNLDTHDGEISFANVGLETDTIALDDQMLINDISADEPQLKKITVQQLKTFIAGSPKSVSRYSVDILDVDKTIEVLATGTGITAAFTGGNTLTFTIPEGVNLISAKVRFVGYSTLNVIMGTTDMENGSMANRWMPICQVWREDTCQQVTGVTLTMSAVNYAAFTINGLINTTPNHIRLSF